MDNLKELVTKLENAYHDRLVSVILYGSGASETQHNGFSDLNVLCVLKQITPRELGDGEPVVRWWRGHGHPSPLLMSEEEVHHSADSFPVEFRDMQERRKLLYGLDVIADLYVDPRFYRAQLEHDLRSKLFRLRQQASGVLSDDAALMKLCLDSVSTFCVLGRHALAAAHVEVPHERRAVVERLGKAMRADMAPFTTLLDLREKKPAAASESPAELFANYLECVRKMVEFVDGLEDKS
ncbi:MAG TPA: hypothetical protein VGR73_22865 [Bryobacteraceae bacterium]|nr:hypothetical protein [Bryobacteraceae bacterium]